MQNTQKGKKVTVNRKYKDSMFTKIFSDKKELLSLFNVINNTHYDDPEELIINTLDNAIYMTIKNDVSCILALQMNLYEHQSTVNPNLPLRNLFYVSQLYEKQISDLDIYSPKQILLPTPKFVVFYNGTEKQPERKVMRLSDSYMADTGETNLELVVTQLNINEGQNKELLEKCKTLGEYAIFVDKVKAYAKEYPYEEAVELTVQECIKEGILKKFLLENRREVPSMSILYEFDEELHNRTMQEIAREEGMAKGREEGRIEMIQNMLRKEKTPEDISEMTEQPIEYVYQVQREMLSAVGEKTIYGEEKEE